VGSEFGGGGGNRTRVRQHSAYGSTCLVLSIDLAVNNPTDRALTAILIGFNNAAPGKLCCDLVSMRPTEKSTSKFVRRLASYCYAARA